jgi:translation initiation factor IF-2
MPSKPKSSSSPPSAGSSQGARKTARPAAEEAPPDAAPKPVRKTATEMKSAALDLLSEKPKRVRTPAAVPAAAAIAAPAAAPLPPAKKVLSLIDGEEKVKRRRTLEPVAEVPAEEAPAVAEEPDGSVVPAAEVGASFVPGDDKVISIKPPIVVRDLAEKMGMKVFVLIKDLMELDIFANPSIAIEAEIAARICEKHGFVFEREKRKEGGGIHRVEEVIVAPPAPEEAEIPEERLEPRAPIITFMGHVDHGKTSLIDCIRKAKVAAGEAGGITQHIGAYSVDLDGHRITVLDTPGHAAFTAMRARGAHVTDIVVLVVAADDGIMPQTKEAIAHAKAAGVKIVVAINKADLKTANIDRVKSQLQDEGLAPEDWGGDTICVPVSALKGEGIDTLLQAALLEAEMLELRADPKAPCRALVIESRVEPGKGPTATLIPQIGTIRIGTPFICGQFSGKVKSMLSDRGQPIREAGPATPVEVIGFSGLPGVGEELIEMDSERSAKRLGEERLEAARITKLATPRRAALETLFASAEDGQKKFLKVILKTDVQGSLEALSAQLREIKSDKVSLNFVLEGVGPVSENDILLASASDAVVLGFGVKVEGKAVKTAKAEGVQVKLYSIIYELIDQVKEAMLGLLEPETREKVVGHAQVKQVFKIQRGRVGGCVVTDGRIVRSARARVLRGKQPVYDGGFHTLRRFHDDVQEVRNGLECGIRLGDFNEYEPGDIIECYELEKIAQSL